MILIVAGTARHAELVARHKRLNPREYRYVLGPGDVELYGPKDAVVWKYETWWQNNRSYEALRVAEMRGIPIEEVHI